MDTLFTFWDEQLQLLLPRLHAHFADVGVMPQVSLSAALARLALYRYVLSVFCICTFALLRGLF